MLEFSTIEALVTLVNALAAGAALIIHAWGHTPPPRGGQAPPQSVRVDTPSQGTVRVGPSQPSNPAPPQLQVVPPAK